MKFENDSKKLSIESMVEYVKNFDGFHDNRIAIESMVKEQVKRYKDELKLNGIEVKEGSVMINKFDLKPYNVSDLLKDTDFQIRCKNGEYLIFDLTTMEYDKAFNRVFIHETLEQCVDRITDLDLDSTLKHIGEEFKKVGVINDIKDIKEYELDEIIDKGIELFNEEKIDFKFIKTLSYINAIWNNKWNCDISFSNDKVIDFDFSYYLRNLTEEEYDKLKKDFDIDRNDIISLITNIKDTLAENIEDRDVGMYGIHNFSELENDKEYFYDMMKFGFEDKTKDYVDRVYNAYKSIIEPEYKKGVEKASKIETEEYDKLFKKYDEKEIKDMVMKEHEKEHIENAKKIKEKREKIKNDRSRKD